MAPTTSRLLALAATATLVLGSRSRPDFSNLPGYSSPVEGFSLDLSELRLVQFSENEPPVWMSELEKVHAKVEGKQFFDITDTPDLGSFVPQVATKAFPPPSASDLVGPVIATLSTDGPESNLKTFSSFRTRHYRSDTGKESQKWLLGKISDVTNEFASPYLLERIDIAEFPHSWGQNSIITRIKGSAPVDGAVIVTAHQDSTNQWPFLPAPGADDDGSGTVTILETYRALLAANFTPVNDVEFHWYSRKKVDFSALRRLRKITRQGPSPSVPRCSTI